MATPMFRLRKDEGTHALSESDVRFPTKNLNRLLSIIFGGWIRKRASDTLCICRASWP